MVLLIMIQNLPSSVLHLVNAQHTRWATHNKQTFCSDVLQDTVDVQCLSRYACLDLDLQPFWCKFEIVDIKVY